MIKYSESILLYAENKSIALKSEFSSSQNPNFLTKLLNNPVFVLRPQRIKAWIPCTCKKYHLKNPVLMLKCCKMGFSFLCRVCVSGKSLRVYTNITQKMYFPL